MYCNLSQPGEERKSTGGRGAPMLGPAVAIFRLAGVMSRISGAMFRIFWDLLLPY